MLVDVGLKFERAEMQMIRWMCGITLKDRTTNEELRRLVGVEYITPFMRGGRLRWYGHVMRTGGTNVWSIELKTSWKTKKDMVRECRSGYG